MSQTNELLYHRYVKQVSKLGVPRYDAKDIVETALSAGKGAEVEMYINYAITLKYGLSLPKSKIMV